MEAITELIKQDSGRLEIRYDTYGKFFYGTIFDESRNSTATGTGNTVEEVMNELESDAENYLNQFVNN